jgi:ribosomal-protein-alanine N-acetyltransferase
VSSESLQLPEDGLHDGVVAVTPYRRDDVLPLLAGAQDHDVGRFAFVQWASNTPEQLLERIEHLWPELAREGRSLNCAIRARSTDELLGHFLLYGVHRRAARAEVGFWLLPEARGRGATARALELVCRWTFTELGLQRIQATTDVDNHASQRTLENAHFQREGILRSYYPTPDGGRADNVMYSRLRAE